MSEHTITVESGKSVRLLTEGKYCDENILVTATGGDTEDAWDEGYNEGYSQGYENGLDEGYSDGYDDGNNDGYDIGYAEGLATSYDKGYDDGYDEGWLDGNDDGYDEGYNRGYDNAIDVVCPIIEETGDAIVCFPMDYVSVVNHEDDAVTVTRCGKNLFDANNYVVCDLYPPSANYPFEAIDNRSVLVEVKPNTTYTINCFLPTSLRLGTSVDYPVSGGAISVYVSRSARAIQPITVTTGPNDKWMVVQLITNTEVSQGYTLENNVKALQIEYGRVSTPYAQYIGETFTIGSEEEKSIDALDGPNCLTTDHGVIEVTGRANPNELLDYVTNEIITLGAYI